MRIHSFESLATLDGDGVRYAIYLNGCPLRCVYCHNPDTWGVSGEDYSAEDLFNKIKRYKPYFGQNGGVTFSGGEPLLSAHFINEVAPLLKEANINYALDTSGQVDMNEETKKAITNSELVILDLKFWDNDSYFKYTGKTMAKTLTTLYFLNAIQKRTWIRTVIVPGINDSKEALDKYIEILKLYPFIEKYELLAFHTMGFFKYENLGIDNPLKDVPPMDQDKLKDLQSYVDSRLKNSN
ncbi:MAG: pyruvate formate lyase-activating protein [Clostridiales bacterium]|nr:pyruvate formate lyase-activating protein [Clostridiales bacterium]